VATWGLQGILGHLTMPVGCSFATIGSSSSLQTQANPLLLLLEALQ
jgi:hypothetical protein